MTMPPTVLIVEDDSRIAASVRRALAYDGYQVSVVGDGRAALDHVLDRRPDLMVLDLMLPQIDGIEVCRRVRAAGDDLPILMLTARDAVPDRVEGLDAGADDYLVKPFAHQELLARVRSLLRRSAGSGRETLRFSDLEVDVDAMEAHRGRRSLNMTALEFRVLEYFARNPRVVLTRGQILDGVWGLDVDTTSNIVDVYVRYLRRKLEAEGEPRLIHTVRGVGYVLKEG